MQYSTCNPYTQSKFLRLTFFTLNKKNYFLFFFPDLDLRYFIIFLTFEDLLFLLLVDLPLAFIFFLVFLVIFFAIFFILKDSVKECLKHSSKSILTYRRTLKVISFAPQGIA